MRGTFSIIGRRRRKSGIGSQSTSLFWSLGLVIALIGNVCSGSVVIHIGGGSSFDNGAGNSIDFDGDGLADFGVILQTMGDAGELDAYYWLECGFDPYGNPAADYGMSTDGSGHVQLLTPNGTSGYVVGPGTQFLPDGPGGDDYTLFNTYPISVESSYEEYYFNAGPLATVNGPPLAGWVGMEVILGDGKLHYAAVDLQATGALVSSFANVDLFGSVNYNVLGYAYETQPNVALQFTGLPEPTSGLIILAGIPIVLNRRRDRRK